MPKCECHGVEKLWSKDSRKKYGGYWLCRILQRERQSRYIKTEKGKIRNRKYRDSVRGYVTKRKWILKRDRQRIVNQLEELQNVRSASDS